MIPIPGISLKLLLLLLLPGTFATAGGLLLRPSSAPKFTTSGFYAYNSDENVGLNDVDGMVAAFGDFNADKATDLIVLSSNQLDVTVYVWARQPWKYEKRQTIVSPYKIVNVVPGDYDHDGKLDLLLMGDGGKGEIKLAIYFGDGDTAFDQKVLNLPSAFGPQPLLLDFFGNMAVDMLGYNDSKSTSTLQVWRNILPKDLNGADRDNLYTIEPANLDKACRLSTPHSSAFVDLDGDCLADIFLTCTDDKYQVFLNNKTEGYNLHFESKLPKDWTAVSFADMDSNGAMDMVIATSRVVYIFYNQQMALCTGSNYKSSVEIEDCRSVHTLCKADSNFKFSAPGDTSNDGLVIFKVDEMLLTKDTLLDPELRIPVRIADYNHDGFPDILLTTSKQELKLYRSIPCTAADCGTDATNAGRRYFVVMGGDKVAPLSGGKALADNIDSNEKILSGYWVDIDENGMLDILVNTGWTTGIFGGAKSRRIRTVLNSFFNDAFFVKILMLNGACFDNCAGRIEGFRPYGVNYIGGTFKYTVIDYQGGKRATQVAQLPQTGYMAGLTPYALVGLGRTNNYIEELFLGSTRHQPEHFTTKSGVIPNSQLIIIPHQPEDSKDPSGWKLELFINPSDYVGYVTMALFATLVILGIVVGVLNRFERLEDEREKRELLHEINFDAL